MEAVVHMAPSAALLSVGVFWGRSVAREAPQSVCGLRSNHLQQLSRTGQHRQSSGMAIRTCEEVSQRITTVYERYETTKIIDPSYHPSPKRVRDVFGAGNRFCIGLDRPPPCSCVRKKNATAHDRKRERALSWPSKVN